MTCSGTSLKSVRTALTGVITRLRLAKDPPGPSGATDHVGRGGSSIDESNKCSTTIRYQIIGDRSFFHDGLRLVLSEATGHLPIRAKSGSALSRAGQSPVAQASAAGESAKSPIRELSAQLLSKDLMQDGTMWKGLASYEYPKRYPRNFPIELTITRRDGDVFEGIYKADRGRVVCEVKGTVRNGYTELRVTKAVTGLVDFAPHPLLAISSTIVSPLKSNIQLLMERQPTPPAL